MRARSHLRLLTTVIAVVGMLALPTAAFATYTTDAADFLTCIPEDPEPGETVDCTAGYFDGLSEVDANVIACGEVVLDTTLTANSDGEVAFSFTMPDSCEEGDDYTAVLSGTRNGIPNTVSGSGEVADEDDQGEDEDEDVADTGADSGLLAVVALGALAIGGGALFVSRRQRSTTSA